MKGRPTLIGVHPSKRNACPVCRPNFTRGPLLWGKVFRGGFRLVAFLSGVAQPSSALIIPGDPNFPRGPPLVVVVYGVWGPVLQAHAWGRLAIVGAVPTPLPQGRTPPTPRGRNSLPSLSLIPIYLLLYGRLCSDRVGSAADSSLSPVPSPVTPSGVICLVCRDSIVFVAVVVVVAHEISTVCTSYYQLSPPIKKLAL